MQLEYHINIGDSHTSSKDSNEPKQKKPLNKVP
jgi:hypothetical protein